MVVVLVAVAGAYACNKTDALDLMRKASIEQNVGLYNAAVATLTKAIESGTLGKDDLAIAYANRGTAYRDKKQYDRAIEDYTKAVELNPGDAIGYTGRGYAHIRKKQYSRAIEDYNKAIEVNPKNIISYYNKACAYSLMNDPQESCRWLGITVEKGYSDWNTIKNDSDFKNIRNAACYKKLMAGE